MQTSRTRKRYAIRFDDRGWRFASRTLSLARKKPSSRRRDPISPDRSATFRRPSARHVIRLMPAAGHDNLSQAKASPPGPYPCADRLLAPGACPALPALPLIQYSKSATEWHLEKNVLAKRTHLTATIAKSKQGRFHCDRATSRPLFCRHRLLP